MELDSAVFRACKILVDHFEECLARTKAGMSAGFHSRVFSHFLHPEVCFVSSGKSKAVIDGEPSHLEHVVPCVVLFSEVCRLLEANIEKEKIAHYLSKHWKVAYISKAEAKLLDSKDQLNLKKSMPEGWAFETGDTFARLNLAGIELVQ